MTNGRERKGARGNERRAGAEGKRAGGNEKRAEGDRKRLVERVRRQLLSGGWPRIFVSFLLMLTGAAGFLTSYALLHLGVTKMAVRYPLAVLAAYTVFLLLLRLWLATRRKTVGDPDSTIDVVDFVPNVFDSGSAPVEDAFKLGGGGDFGGGGAGGGWVADATSIASSPVGNSASLAGSPVGGSTSGGGGGSWDLDLGFDLDLGEGCALLIIPIVAVVGLIVVMFYVVYAAPVLLAEILVDGLLLAGLYKRLKGVESRHWLRSAVRRTLAPALLTTALFIGAGYLMQRAIPEARSIGDFWHRALAKDDDKR
ncbi:MAG TPA: hypothetical protein VER76_00090 [Pyrinomonadaceae bacterium]|nr:hypothetical protein [Pyrinomonadaceae bacterium]